jgi:hypothetical protein
MEDSASDRARAASGKTIKVVSAPTAKNWSCLRLFITMLKEFQK